LKELHYALRLGRLPRRAAFDARCVRGIFCHAHVAAKNFKIICAVRGANFPFYKGGHDGLVSPLEFAAHRGDVPLGCRPTGTLIGAARAKVNSARAKVLPPAKRLNAALAAKAEIV